MPRSATVEAPFTHQGTELVGVVSGLVQVGRAGLCLTSWFGLPDALAMTNVLWCQT